MHFLSYSQAGANPIWPCQDWTPLKVVILRVPLFSTIEHAVVFPYYAPAGRYIGGRGDSDPSARRWTILGPRDPGRPRRPWDSDTIRPTDILQRHTEIDIHTVERGVLLLLKSTSLQSEGLRDAE